MAVNLPFPGGSAPADIRAYLVKLVNDLNRALNNIDTGNLSPALSKAVSSYASGADTAQQIATLLNKGEIPKSANVRKLYTELRTEVFANVENVEATFASLIEQTNSEIRAYVQANYIGTDDATVLQETLTSLIAQTAEQIRLEFTTMGEVNADAISALSVLFSTYFAFTVDGLEIGETGDGASDIVTRISADRIEFVIRDTDVVVAYIDAGDEKMHIASGTFEHLVAGISGAQRVEVGYNAAFEPYVMFYDNAGNQAMTILKNSIDYGNGVRTAPWSIGDEHGIGDFIV